MCRAPVAAAPLGAQGLLYEPLVMGRGILAHYAAEAVLSAPQVTAADMPGQTDCCGLKSGPQGPSGTARLVL